MKDYCLDSWAVLAWLEGVEPAAARVQEVFEAGTPVMSWINAGEVYYVVHRRASRAAALEVLAELRRRTMLELPSEARVLQAAAIKAEHPVAYADAFAVATALARGATLLTGDPEILAGPEGWPIEDLRANR